MPVAPRESPRAKPLLSIVIPTRNRAAKVRRLLLDLGRQSLAAAQFEVVVVDDGSEPPLALRGGDYAFRLTVIRRDGDHGAHAARRRGLRAAAGERVLFLDDDVALDPRVLEIHAACTPADRIGLGPIRYPQTGVRTPFLRYMARDFDAGNEWCLAHLVPGEYWVCNSSAPAALLTSAFDRLARRHPGRLLGGAHDETMLKEMFRELGARPVGLREALTWHLDDKKLAECCEEVRLAQEQVARNMRAGWFAGRRGDVSGNRGVRDLRSRARRAAMRWHWRFPGVLRAFAAGLQRIADHGPPRLVPAAACRIPLMVAHWDGWRACFPDYREFAALVNDAAPRMRDGVEGVQD